MDIQTKDGILLRNIPDGTPDDVIKARIANIRGQGAGSAPAKIGAEGFGAALKSTLDESGWGARNLAGAGTALSNLWEGGKQILGKGDPQAIEANRIMAEKAPVGSLAGNVALLAPTALIPGANTIAGAGAVGALTGALQPTQGNESRVLNAVMGGAGGAGGQGVGNVLSKALRPVASTLIPEESRLMSVALKEGIPLDAAAQTGSKPLKIINSVFDNLPFTSAPQAERVAATQSAYNAAALKRAGIDATTATPEVLGTQKKSLGTTFQDIAERNAIDFNRGDIVGKLGDIAHEASRRLANKGEGVVNTVDDMVAEVGKTGLMPGAKYQGWREELGRLARGNDTEAHYFGQVKKALDNAFSEQVSTADAQAWKTASRQYANLKTILNAQGGAGNAANIGDIAPAQLSRALNQAMGKEGKALGRGDLNDLVRVGQMFVRDQVPNSGTAQRALYQALLTGSGAGIGAGGAAATGHDPLAGAAYGAAGMGASLMAPRLAQALINSGPVQSYMVHQAASPTAKALAQALKLIGRTAGTVLPLQSAPAAMLE